MDEHNRVHTILHLLDAWVKGDVNEENVHIHAEAMFEDLQTYTQEPSRTSRMSIIYEVLSNLSVLHYQLITPDDVPIIIQFLNTPAGYENEAWDQWIVYWDTVDFNERRKKLQEKPYYVAHPFPFETSNEKGND